MKYRHTKINPCRVCEGYHEMKRGIGQRCNGETNEGLIESYIHNGGRVGSIVEISCETDFVARTEEFIKCAKEIAMQVAAMSPISINKEDNEDYEDEQILELQAYIRDYSKTVGEVEKELSARVGENIVIKKNTFYFL